MKPALVSLFLALLTSSSAAPAQEPVGLDRPLINHAKALTERDWLLQTRLRISPWDVGPVDELGYRERWSEVLRQLEIGAFRPGRTSLVGTCRETCAILNAVTIEFRQSLACEEPERAVVWSETAVELALNLFEGASQREKALSLAHLFIALPEAWRDEDLSRLNARAATHLDQLVAHLEDRLPREFEELLDPEGINTPEESELYLVAANDSLRALRVQLRFLRMANALHQGREVPVCPDEPGGQILLEAAEGGQFLLCSSYKGSGRRSPYSRLVTLR